jgi:hypothetical protein
LLDISMIPRSVPLRGPPTGAQKPISVVLNPGKASTTRSITNLF